MKSNLSHGSNAILVLAATILLTVLSSCQAAGPPAATPTPGAADFYLQATITPNPAHANFTPTPTRPSMREQKEALGSELDEAIAKLTEAIEDDPTDVGAYSDRGEAYAQQGELESAIADFTKALELDPDLVAAYNFRGKAYSEQRKFDEAIADFTKAIELDAEYAIAYYNRGVAYQSSDKRKEAAADYKEYLRLEPDAPQKSRLKQQIQMFGG